MLPHLGQGDLDLSAVPTLLTSGPGHNCSRIRTTALELNGRLFVLLSPDYLIEVLFSLNQEIRQSVS